MDIDTEMADAFREDAMDELRHHRYHYAARPDYLTSLSWISVPVRAQSPSTASSVNILANTHKGLACSAVIGVINTGMAMEPHGNCTNSAQLVKASFEFSLSAPSVEDYPQLHADYLLAMSRFQTLQYLIHDPGSLDEDIVPFLSKDGETLSFYHPLFLRSAEVSGSVGLLSSRIYS